MPQRTEFPQIPNTAESSYLAVLVSLFQELHRQGGAVPFKTFRPWLKERNIYNKEEVEALFTFVGCEWKPTATLGDFGKKMLACKTPEGQQETLFRWLDLWNPLLTKYILEALDVESGGRLHSTHELYRMITSYVYAGEYVTLHNFQSWIKWMAASGYIRYIGIRWGLSERGKQEMPRIRQFDVDEWLEDQEDAEDAALDAPAVSLDGAAAAGAPDVAAHDAATPDSSVADDQEELPPDMPPEAPVPVWEPPQGDDLQIPAAPTSTAEVAPNADKPAAGASPLPQPTAVPVVRAAPPRPLAVGPTSLDARSMGLDSAGYDKAKGVFLLEMVVLARLAVDATGSDWPSFFRGMQEQRLIRRWYQEDNDLGQLLTESGFFGVAGELVRLVLVDLLRAGTALKADPALPNRLEKAAQEGSAAWRLHTDLFGGELTAAPLWLTHAMVAMGLWKKFAA